jgi:hypothetical protein
MFPAPKRRSSSNTWSLFLAYEPQKNKCNKEHCSCHVWPSDIGYKLRTCKWLKIRNRDTEQVTPLPSRPSRVLLAYIICYVPQLRRICKRDAEDMWSVIQPHCGSCRAVLWHSLVPHGEYGRVCAVHAITAMVLCKVVCDCFTGVNAASHMQLSLMASHYMC